MRKKGINSDEYGSVQLFDQVEFLYPYQQERLKGGKLALKGKGYLVRGENSSKLSEKITAFFCLLLGIKPYDKKSQGLAPCSEDNVLTYADASEKMGQKTTDFATYTHTLNETLRDLVGESDSQKQYIVNKRKVGYYCVPPLTSNIKKKKNKQYALKTDFSAPQLLKPYYLPDYYEPSETYHNLCNNVFKNGDFVHVLFGHAGMGKTLMAEYFANQCCKGSARTDLNFKTVIRTYYAENLEQTIATLPYDDSCLVLDPYNIATRYQEKLELLKNCPKPTLLIIDNYDENLDELDNNKPSHIYKDLALTECNILITSRLQPRGNILRKTEISSLSPEALYRLFFKVVGWTEIDRVSEENRKKDVMELLKDLHFNTFLTCITARLAQTIRVIDLRKALHELSITKNQERISNIEKDNINCDDKTLLDICQTLFDFSKLNEDEDAQCFLYNLAMIPMEGMDYETFLEMAFEENKRIQMRKYRDKLVTEAWVYFNSDTRTISLHPLVREMIAIEMGNRKQSVWKEISTYLKSLSERFQIEFYHPGLDWQLKVALGSYYVLKKLEIDSKDDIFQEYTFLIADISGAYNDLKQNELCQKYGREALEKLDCLQSALAEKLDIPYVTLDDIIKRYDSLKNCKTSESVPENFEQLSHYTRSMNIVGFSFSQPGENKNKELSKSTLLKSASLVLKLLESYPQDDSLQMLFSKNLGNLAGLYLLDREYKKALEFHKKASEIRKDICERRKISIIQGSKSDLETFKRYRAFLGSSYKGMATAYFYLAKTDAASYYKESVDCHKKAYSLLKENLPVGSVDLVAEANRFTGAAVSYIRNCQVDDMEKDELLASVYNNQCDAAYVLLKLPKFYEYIEDCQSKLLDILDLMPASTDSRDTLITAVEDLFKTPYDKTSKTENVLKRLNKVKKQ